MAATTRIYPGMAPSPRLVPTSEMVQLAHEIHEALQEAITRKIVRSVISEETLAEWFATFAERNICARWDDFTRTDILLHLHTNATLELCHRFVKMCGYLDAGDRYIPLSRQQY